LAHGPPPRAGKRDAKIALPTVATVATPIDILLGDDSSPPTPPRAGKALR
jgi:hypothetical protein